MTESLVDPQLQAFEEDDPSLLVDPNTLEPSGPPLPDFGHKRSKDEVAIEMAAAFLVVVGLVARHLREQAPPNEPVVVAGQAWRHHAPIWLRLMVPAVKQAYALGSMSGLTPEEIDGLAHSYASDLGDYMDQSSGEVLLQGFNQQLAGGWSREVAWQRAGAAYGTDSANMRGIMATLVNRKIPPEQREDPVTVAARMAIDKALMNRATTVGDTETHRATQMGQALAWMVRRQKGLLPVGAGRRWNTKAHETSCEICGPMDGVVVPLDQPFELSDGTQLWAPGAHPNCECDLSLVDADGEEISKALGDDPYDRLKDGRFAATEHRTRGPVTTKVMERDPVVDEILSQVNAFGIAEGQKVGDLFAEAKKHDLFGEAKGSLFGDAKGSLFRSPQHDLFAEPKGDLFATPKADLFDNSATANPGKAKNAMQHVLIVTRKRQGPPPTPKHESHYLDFGDIADYYYEEWGGEPSVLPGDAIDFDELNDYYTRVARERADAGMADRGRQAIEAHPHSSVWSAATDQIWDIDNDDWDSVLSQAVPVWHQALHHVDSITAQLTASDLREIHARAGYSPSSDVDFMRDHIASTVHDQSSPDRSLEEAYADYVTWTRPDLVGDNGLELSHHMAALLGDSDDVDFAVEPVRVLSFNQGFHNGTPELLGTYEATHVVYHSVIADYGKDAPVGHLSVQELEMEPIGKHDVGSDFSAKTGWADSWPEDDDPDPMAEKHPWD